MPVRSSSQTSFFSPEYADPTSLAKGSLPWLLRRFAAVLWPAWLFGDWHGHGRRGRNAWPASVLMSTLLLRFLDGGMSRRAMVRRLAHDISWRAATALEIGGDTPAESTFRRFEKYLSERDRASGVPRYLLAHEHLLRVCRGAGVVGPRAIWTTDSTPMWCFGAARDTVRMLGDGLRSLCRQWARLTGRSVRELARDWELPLLLAKSTKGAYRINWRDPEARATVVDRVAKDVLRIIDRVRHQIGEIPSNKRKGLLQRCADLAKVVADDLEVDVDGRLVIARRVAADRLVSITDPQARHGRKTKSKPFRGFKVHLLGDVVSGLIASVAVTAGNVGDNQPAHRLIRRAKRVFSEITQVLGDTAYGTAELHVFARRLEGVDVLAPPRPVTRPARKLDTTDFTLDTSVATATCPGGVTTRIRQGPKTRYASWKKASCDACELRSKCVPARSSSKTLWVHPHHEELVLIRTRWQDAAIREQYRLRSQCERLVNQVVRHGGRKAMAWGLQTATLQAYLIAMRSNLGCLARHLAAASGAEWQAANDLPVSMPATGTSG